MMLQFLRTTGYHWFWRQWWTLVKLVLVSIFLFSSMLSLETAKMMMKVWCAGRMDILPSVFSCSFLCFLVGYLSLVALPPSLYLFFRFLALSPMFCFLCSPCLYYARLFSFSLCWFLLYMLVLRMDVYNHGWEEINCCCC